MRRKHDYGTFLVLEEIEAKVGARRVTLIASEEDGERKTRVEI